MLTISPVARHGWPSVWQLNNPAITMEVLADVGPRIYSLNLSGRPNLFFHDPEDAGQTGGTRFRMYGGHRFWIAPENERTMFADNHSVEVEQKENVVTFTAAREPSGLQKSLAIELAPQAPRIKLTHRVTNHAAHQPALAPWALSVFKPGGRAVLPLPERAPHGPQHLLPTASLALWSYTDLSADFWRLGSKYIQLDQRNVGSHGFGMQKFGLLNPQGWGAYFLDGDLFIKAVHCSPGNFPDLGSSFEVFANKDFIELESLGHLVELPEGSSVEHVEHWGLWNDIPPGDDDAWADREILPRALELLAGLRS